ncbi:LysR family transcriptional regulator [Pseudonocardia sp. DSM 110487]|uniref:LysR family transcriptional regulator n=1 Tax=Pseudonocardia sp. DSM 110487 TaxID=2865833 RepID=UPI002107A247|nr:LysR family transcriptional regulator [Pseudonocardia sp. DSM 110487]
MRHLRSFLAVAEELHFGRAAKRLFLVQSALSRQISALERELDVALLERDRHHVNLTPAGRALLEDVRQLLGHADETTRRARAAGRGTAGTLRLGFIAPALYAVLPPLLRAFRARNPEVRLVLEEMHNQQAVESIRTRRVQVALVRLPVGQSTDLHLRPIHSEEVLLAVPEDHRLAGRSDVPLGDLADTDLILIARGLEPELHDYYTSACAEAGFAARVAHEVDRTHVALGLVASGLGAAFVPASARRVAQPGVVLVRLTGAELRLRMAAAWTDAADPVLARFLDLCPDGAKEA